VQIAAGPWTAGIEQAWADLGDFVPRLALGLGVLVVAYLCAVVTAKLVALAMDRVATAEERRGRVLTVAVRLRRAAPRLVRLGVLLVGLWTAVEVVDPGSGESPAADFVDALRGLLVFLGAAALLTVCAVVVVGVGGGLVRPMERRWELWISRLEAPAAADSARADATDDPEPAEPETADAEPETADAGPAPTRPASRERVSAGVGATRTPVAEPGTQPQPVADEPSRTQVIPTVDTPEAAPRDKDDAAGSRGADGEDATRTDVVPEVGTDR
jgi:hypothetical protein